MASEQLTERALGAFGSMNGGAAGGSWMTSLAGMFGGARGTGHVLNSEQTRALASHTNGRNLNQTLNVKIEGRPDRRTPEQIARASGQHSRRALSRTG